MSHATIRDEDIPADVYQRRWFILGVLNACLLVVIMANTTMNVALPTMAEALRLSSSSQQWVVDAYSLVFAGLLFTAGALGDRFGRKNFLLIGLAIFGLASVYATFFADTGGEVIATRALMGAGGALVMPTTLSILVNAFPSAERPKAIAVWSGIAGAGGAVGLLLGGWLVEHFWWGSTFALNIPIAIAAVVIGAWLLPETKDPSSTPIDIGGAILSALGLGVLVYGLIEGPHWGWTSMQTLGTIAAGLVVLAGFVAYELRVAHPLLDMRLFRDRRFSVSSAGVTLIFLVMFGFFFIGVQFMQIVLAYSPFESGIRMLPFIAVMIPASVTAPRLVARFGTRLVASGGMVIVAVAMMLLAALTADSGYGELVVAMSVMAVGLGLTATPMTNLIMSSVPRSHAGVGSAMNDTTREVGTTLGVAILGSVLSSAYVSHLPREIGMLPAEAAGLVRDSIGGAYYVAGQIGGSIGQQLTEAATGAWMQGTRLAFHVGAGIAVLAAVISFLFLSRDDLDIEGPDDVYDDDENEDDPVGSGSKVRLFQSDSGPDAGPEVDSEDGRELEPV